MPAKMRVRRPRTNWIIETAKAAWKEWRVHRDNTSDEGQQDDTEFQHDDRAMVKELVRLAKLT